MKQPNSMPAILRSTIDALVQPKALWLFLAGIITLATVAFVVADGRLRPASLWFPYAREEGAGAELRLMKKWGNGDAAVLELVEELLLGPMDPRFKAFVLPNTGVRSTFVRGRKVYVDIEADAFFGRKSEI